MSCSVGIMCKFCCQNNDYCYKSYLMLLDCYCYWCVLPSNSKRLNCSRHLLLSAMQKLILYVSILDCVASYWVYRMEAQGESGRVDTTMSNSRIPSPADLSCPVAENWCYTQVCSKSFKSCICVVLVQHCTSNPLCPHICIILLKEINLLQCCFPDRFQCSYS